MVALLLARRTEDVTTGAETSNKEDQTSQNSDEDPSQNAKSQKISTTVVLSNSIPVVICYRCGEIETFLDDVSGIENGTVDAGFREREGVILLRRKGTINNKNCFNREVLDKSKLLKSQAADDGLIITSERMCLTSSGGRGRAMLRSVQTFRASYIISADTALYRSSLIGLLSLQGKITARKTSCLMPRHSPDAFESIRINV
ncbi:hypothetical protein RB195_010203 [Necator americanus]|uniref:Uncharacterized protein n=1 Tax=Necator americanus TaxID=51031 RepID=A0ABR1CWV1_NECAM